MIEKPKVAFICVHNSCRSQMAEAIAKILAEDVFYAYSAGTEITAEINANAADIIKELYEVNITETQKPKDISEIPQVDIVITMGCNAGCPLLPCQYREDWGLADPTGQSKEVFLKTAELIRIKVLELKQHIENKEI